MKIWENARSILMASTVKYVCHICFIYLRSSSGLTIKEMRIEADPNDFK